MNKKDQHVEIICKKFDLYKSEMEKEFPGDDYPFYNLEPWTNYYVEDEQIAQEDLDFEKWFDEKYAPMKIIEERLDAEMNEKRYFGSTRLEWLIGIIGLIFIAIMILSTHARLS